MMTFLIILLIIACVALALFVLVQNPKGGGLATGNTSGSNMFGVQRTGDVLEKGSWVLLAVIVVLTLSITTIGKSGGGAAVGNSKIQEHLDKTPKASPLSGIGSQTAPAPAPSADTTKK